MSLTGVLDSPSVYLLWQAPFAAKKLAPVRESRVLDRITSVLDIGCGPGTNAPFFDGVDRYLGVDLSVEYVEYARRRFGRDFVVADVTEGIPSSDTFDLVLLNSLMHHLDDDGVLRLLDAVPQLLSRNGEIHIIDLVLADRGVPRFLARADRGKFARPIHEWRELVGSRLTVNALDEFSVGLGPLALWRLVHISAGRV